MTRAASFDYALLAIIVMGIGVALYAPYSGATSFAELWGML